jgi:predicted nucleic acid-binding protein
MPTAAEPLLLDTSAAVPLVLTDHEAHGATTAALSGRALGLAGHAAFETWSVLTRLPGARRLSPAAAGRLLAADFAHSRQLGAQEAAVLLAALASLRLSGGSVYDALVGAVAVQHDLELVSRDRRALGTYARLGVRLRLLD